MFGYLYNIEEQLQQQNWLFRQELEQVIELINAPAVQTVMVDYDQPSFQSQFRFSYTDIDNLVIWPIPPPPSVPPQKISPMAASLNMSKRQRYWIPKALMMEPTGIEQIQYAPGTPLFWDNDAENQRPSKPYEVDRDLSDSGVEKITLNVITDFTWDNDAEQQFLQPVWYYDWFEGNDTFPIIPNVFIEFILGTGTAIPFLFNAGSGTSNITVQGSAAPISASGNVSPSNVDGEVQPLIDVNGELLP